MNSLIKQNKAGISIVIFLIIFFVVYRAKPAIFYESDGALRQFGIGYKHKTVVPLWLFAIVLSILVYIVINFIAMRR